MSTGDCKSDPVSGIAGDIYNAWTGDVDAGLSSDATVSGSTVRKLLGSQIDAIAASINNGIPTNPIAWSVVSKSADFVASTWKHYRVDTTAGAVSATLPSPVGLAGQDITIKKVSSDANRVNLIGTIDGASNPYFTAQWTAITLRSNGSSWDVI